MSASDNQPDIEQCIFACQRWTFVWQWLPAGTGRLLPGSFQLGSARKRTFVQLQNLSGKNPDQTLLARKSARSSVPALPLPSIRQAPDRRLPPPESAAPSTRSRSPRSGRALDYRHPIGRASPEDGGRSLDPPVAEDRSGSATFSSMGGTS